MVQALALALCNPVVGASARVSVWNPVHGASASVGVGRESGMGAGGKGGTVDALPRGLFELL